MRVMTIVGARPQFIKAAVVSKALANNPNINEVLVHTGQHYDYLMSESFFQDLSIPAPTHNLGIGSGSHGAQTGRMMEALEKVVKIEKPDLMMVYGDTNSTLAGALVASKMHIPIAHVEAGLRSFNRLMPEEVNRILTDQVSEILFAPTNTAVENLLREGIPGNRIIMVGDVMFDAAVNFYDPKRSRSLLEKNKLEEGRYILATIHRAENTDNLDRLRTILNELVIISENYPVVFPMHPRTLAVIKDNGLENYIRKNLHCIDPLGYIDMLALEKSARVIITDSGGVQKEAFFAKVPCLIVRDETEWVELVRLNCAKLVSPYQISSEIEGGSSILPEANAISLYGGGTASIEIAKRIALFAGQ